MTDRIIRRGVVEVVKSPAQNKKRPGKQQRSRGRPPRKKASVTQLNLIETQQPRHLQVGASASQGPTRRMWAHYRTWMTREELGVVREAHKRRAA